MLLDSEDFEPLPSRRFEKATRESVRAREQLSSELPSVSRSVSFSIEAFSNVHRSNRSTDQSEILRNDRSREA